MTDHDKKMADYGRPDRACLGARVPAAGMGRDVYPTPADRLLQHGAPIERDGTAIDWDTECCSYPHDAWIDDLVLIAVGVLGWGALLLGIIGAALDWWLP